MLHNVLHNFIALRMYHLLALLEIFKHSYDILPITVSKLAINHSHLPFHVPTTILNTLRHLAPKVVPYFYYISD